MRGEFTPDSGLSNGCWAIHSHGISAGLGEIGAFIRPVRRATALQSVCRYHKGFEDLEVPSSGEARR